MVMLCRGIKGGFVFLPQGYEMDTSGTIRYTGFIDTSNRQMAEVEVRLVFEFPSKARDAT